MTVYEILAVVSIVLVGTFAVVAIYLGMLNWVGALYVVRCTECHHLAFNSANQPRTSCPHCRHPMLTHPIHALRHPDNRTDVRVVGDRLHY
ncbi:MAG: hypothetical protein U1D00_25000 [Mycobacterium sp.]|nr:hypothetical protein [Mycobacterium sp.]